jgi:hypothetical protein
MAQDASTILTNTTAIKGTKKKRSKKIVEEPELCTICASKYTPIIRKKIICKFCSKDACSKCIEHYLISRHEDGHCLHCRVNYNDTMLNEICTKTYLQQTYFRHRQEVLMNRERANLPGLQEEAVRLRNRRESMVKVQALQKELKELKAERNRLAHEHYKILSEYNTKYRELKENGQLADLKARMDQFYEQRTHNLEQIREKKTEYRRLRWENLHGNRENQDGDEEATETKEEEKRKFIRRCMRTGCQGFLSTAWKCGICEWYSCSKCFTVKGQEHDSPHECKKEDIETADMIKKDSKPCPKCGEFINKSSGCSQMFCISCKTPWDWNTGKIVTHGALHNPHYYEWMKRTGGDMPRNPADVPCGGYPNIWELRQINHIIPHKVSSIFYEFHRVCMQIQDITTRQYRRHMDQDDANQINIRFLLRDYDEKTWGRLLATNEKKRKYDAEIQEIFTAFRMVAAELINRVQHYRDERIDSFTLLPPKRAEQFILNLHIEIQELILMINKALVDVSISYSYSVPYIQFLKTNTDIIYYRLSFRNFANEVKKERKSRKTVACNDNTDEKEMEQPQHHSPVPYPFHISFDEKEQVNDDEDEDDEKEDDQKEDDQKDDEGDEKEEVESDQDDDRITSYEVERTLVEQDKELQRAIEESYLSIQKVV